MYSAIKGHANQKGYFEWKTLCLGKAGINIVEIRFTQAPRKDVGKET